MISPSLYVLWIQSSVMLLVINTLSFYSASFSISFHLQYKHPYTTPTLKNNNTSFLNSCFSRSLLYCQNYTHQKTFFPPLPNFWERQSNLIVSNYSSRIYTSVIAICFLLSMPFVDNFQFLIFSGISQYLTYFNFPLSFKTSFPLFLTFCTLYYTHSSLWNWFLLILMTHSCKCRADTSSKLQSHIQIRTHTHICGFPYDTYICIHIFGTSQKSQSHPWA